VKSEINCNSYLVSFLNFSSILPQCKTQREAETSYERVKIKLAVLNEDPDRYGCPFPCELTFYKLTVDYNHKNAIEMFKGVQSNANDYSIFIQYSSTNVEKVEEKLLVSTSALLGSIGGNMGLLLGVSCLSVCLEVLNLIRKNFYRIGMK